MSVIIGESQVISMKENYLIESEYGKKLYQSICNVPIMDYHCHLSPKDIYEDQPYDNIGEMWLAGDHYKWRLMRAFGVDEQYITGDASWREKFQKYAETIAMAAGNPLYHWTHMELSNYFGVDQPLNGESAEDIWNQANQVIVQCRLSPRKLIAMSQVEYIATTDDVTDTLEYHRKIREDATFTVTVAPSFRTDNLLLIGREGYRQYIDKLSKVSGIRVDSLDSFQEAVCRRLDFFVDNGCRFTDVGIEYFPDRVGEKAQAAAAFEKAISGQAVSDEEYHSFLGYCYVFLAAEYQKRGLVMQWHLAVKRNANTALFTQKGADFGGDCIGDVIKGEHIVRVLDAIHSNSGLPLTILYTLNPSMAPMLSSIAGSFPHVICGAAWWFCDHKRGIEEQLNIIAETGHIGTFLGMLTDSRSFLSYARHEYFRRILCNVVGRWVDRGEYPEGRYAEMLVRAISYDNIRKIAGGRV